MAMPALEQHIVLDDRGRACVRGTGVRVAEIVLDKLAYGWSPEETHRQHPHLSLAEIHAALSYYYDHQREIEEEIETDLEYSERLASQAVATPLHVRLRQMGKLP